MNPQKLPWICSARLAACVDVGEPPHKSGGFPGKSTRYNVNFGPTTQTQLIGILQ